MVYANTGTSVSYQLDVLSMSDVLLNSSTHTVSPAALRFPAVSHVSHFAVVLLHYTIYTVYTYIYIYIYIGLYIQGAA